MMTIDEISLMIAAILPRSTRFRGKRCAAAAASSSRNRIGRPTLTDRSWCSYADWIENGPAARFIDHPETRGDHLMMKARAMIAREIANELWSN